MTKLTDTFDALRTTVAATLTSLNELPNPYVIENNASVFLKAGFGVSYSDGSNSNRIMTGGYDGIHAFTVTLTRQVTSTENDIDGFVSIQNQIYTDADTLIKEIRANPTLGGAVANIDWVGYEPIDYLIDENDIDKFIALPINFNASYFA